jgi:hypothetical protein
MKILTENGRNKHGQRCVKAECACGVVFDAIYNNIKNGRTKTCGKCGKPQTRKIKPEIPPEVKSEHAYGSVAWFDERIAVKKAAAIQSENRAAALEAKLAVQEFTDMETHKAWNTEASDARKLRAEILRMITARDKVETGTKKDTRTQAEITRDKIASLKGGK